MAEADGTVEFFGEHFAVPDRLNSRRLNQLAVIGKQAEAAEKRGDQAATADLMRDFKALVEALFVMCVRSEDRERMDALCDEVCPTDEELMEFVGKVAAAVGQRPTQRSNASSSGPTTTSGNSAGDFSSPVERLERQGRPDLALLVTESQAARSA